MKYREFPSNLISSLSEAGGEERKLAESSGGTLLCQVGSSSPLEFRKVSSDGTTLQVVGGLRKLARSHKGLTVNYCWLTKDPRDSQKYLSIFVSKGSISLSDKTIERMFGVPSQLES